MRLLTPFPVWPVLGATILAAALVYSSHVQSMDTRCSQLFNGLESSLGRVPYFVLMEPIAEDSDVWRVLRMAESINAVTLEQCAQR
ncbi:hypothetical protein HPA02_02990 [Bisbaumannia pacifica]|uniref:Uncharacterized protein n=1 Tax=Bisbaumannia pacifica TaxID=77098 RepID=A0A510X3N6_9GAMM|nr:hypothetical protein HPA02_02990 [Halomonas pacifica]